MKNDVVNKDYVRKITTSYKKLSQRCDEVNINKEGARIREIVVALKNTIKEKNLTGLSAVQIGSYDRIICMNFNGDLKTFVNPIIVAQEGLELSREKCSSIPGKEFIRPRNIKVTVMYQTPLGKVETKEFIGMAARVMQHHIDHLDGLILSDVGLEIDSDFDNATDEERQEVIDMYLQSLDLSAKEIETELAEDEEAKEFMNGIKFLQSVANGETQIEQEELTQQEKVDLSNAMNEYIELNKEQFVDEED